MDDEGCMGMGMGMVRSMHSRNTHGCGAAHDGSHFRPSRRRAAGAMRPARPRTGASPAERRGRRSALAWYFLARCGGHATTAAGRRSSAGAAPSSPALATRLRPRGDRKNFSSVCRPRLAADRSRAWRITSRLVNMLATCRMHLARSLAWGARAGASAPSGSPHSVPTPAHTAQRTACPPFDHACRSLPPPPPLPLKTNPASMSRSYPGESLLPTQKLRRPQRVTSAVETKRAEHKHHSDGPLTQVPAATPTPPRPRAHPQASRSSTHSSATGYVTGRRLRKKRCVVRGGVALRPGREDEQRERGMAQPAATCNVLLATRSGSRSCCFARP
eukprot:352013-Chlamydomonas_euryale.AAC.1